MIFGGLRGWDAPPCRYCLKASMTVPARHSRVGGNPQGGDGGVPHVIADLIRNPERHGHRAAVIHRVPHRHSRVGGNPQGGDGGRHTALEPV